MAQSSRWLVMVSVIGILGGFTLGGCSGEKPKPDQARFESADPSAEVSQLETNVMQAKSNHVDVLAPSHFEESQKALRDAKKMRSEGKDYHDVLSKVSESQRKLDRANEMATISNTVMNSVIVARNDALASGASQYFPDEFKKVENTFKDRTHAIEDGESPKKFMNQQGELIRDYRKLEIKGLREANLGDSLRRINQAKKEDAEKWAPKTLSMTERKSAELDRVIHQDPKNKDQIASLSKDLGEQSDLLLRVTRLSKKTEGRNPEQTALNIELQKKEIARLGKEAESNQAALERQHHELASNKQFQEFSSRFTPDEAEVFKTPENKIVIRLKGLDFAKSGAQIPTQDFALLNKVSDIVKEYEGNPITVEGHADATGSKRSNDKLSEKRAEAVKEYLVANRSVSPDSISSVGKGFSKPIASNKTKEGRAQNRRVDIVIEPTT